MQDQLDFQAASGDRNPIHVDANYARKAVTGRLIVHGVHAVMWAVESALLHKDFSIFRISAKFLQPIFIDEYVELWFEETSHEFFIKSGDIRHVKIKVVSDRTSPTPWREGHYGAPLVFSNLEAPAVLEKNDLRENTTFDIPILSAPAHVQKLFANITRVFGISRACELANLSSVVGMVVPGLNSIFASFDISINQKQSAINTVTIDRFDERFSIVDSAYRGSYIEGKIRSVLRPEVLKPVGVEKIRVTDDLMQGAVSRSVVIGGSRGLGATITKMLALAGHRVLFTYYAGEEDAETLRNELTDKGCEVDYTRLDVRNCEFGVVTNFEPTHIFYFATPKIFVKRAKTFEQKLYKQFFEFYVESFESLLTSLSKEGHFTVYYPSTIAVESFSEQAPEYAKAKLLGEKLCDAYNKEGNLSVISQRLPRTLSDQTVSHLPVENKNPIEVCNEILRKVFGNA